MLIQNLKLKFDKQENGQMFFVTDNGLKLVLPELLMEQYTEKTKPIYLSADYQTQMSSVEKSKEILNDLLNNKD